MSDLVNAIQQKTVQLCRKICGGVPESKEECIGVSEEAYVCQLRRISDDATFHA